MHGKLFDSQKDHHSMLLENELSWNPDFKENRTAIDREFRRYFRIANARNPFSRLYSAWNDKSRTHLHQNGSIDFTAFKHGHYGVGLSLFYRKNYSKISLVVWKASKENWLKIQIK